TRWKGSKARSIGAGFKLFYYGVDSKRNGVGVVLKEEFVRNVLEVKRVSDRVMSLKLEIEGVMLNVVSGYAPQVGCELGEKERFWSELDEVMESIPTGERVVIGADFNGNVGEGNTGDEEVMGKFGVKERNLEGQMVVDFAKRMDMAVVNTYFQKREGHRVPYKSGGRSTQGAKRRAVVLYEEGLAEKYVRVVQDMYERSRTVVRCVVGQTEEFKVEVGLHQGSALSPFLFAIVMDQLSEEVKQESPWTMMFADDIVICSENREQVEENLERWRFALERRGMKVSHSKTEYMCMNEREGSGTVRLQGEEVKKVQEFKYLGSTVQSNGECGKEAKEDAFRNGDRVLYNQARNTLNKEIRVAKRSYAKKLENQFSANDPASVWKGLKYITNYKTPSPSTEANQQLAEDLNEFYCRFETAGLTPHAPSEHLSIQPLTPPATPLSSPPALRISEDDVRQIFLKQKKRKAPGPDGVTPVCPRTCADQLAFIFSQIFNRSLELCEVPACFKRSTIIPIPKKPKMTGFNDYRPVALTSVVMKSFERLVLAYLKNITGPLLDPLQFAYRANRSVDDAVNMGLHFILQHLDKSGTYVRLLFVDFSSAFNTIIPTLLQTKLTQLSVPSSICQWITSFLTDRHQLVKLGKFKSNSRTTSTGAPQGCVLSPLLFSLYTNDCTSTDPSIKLLKFADDTTVIGLIQDGDESAYRQEIEQLAAWCSRNNLELNTLKTVEMIVDFRRNTPALPPLTIMNSTVPTVASFRFLGTTISQDLKWDTHIDATIKKAQQRLYFLRQLRKFNLPQELLIHFYSAVIDIVSPACPGSSPEPLPGGVCPEHLPREMSQRRPKQMPEPPQLPPFDVEEQRLYSELLPGDRAPYPISKGAPRHATEEAHFGRLYPGSYPFGHDPEL
ncbi:hypothetical protein QTP70_023211, partial [Hemibagrus guttatus]